MKREATDSNGAFLVAVLVATLVAGTAWHELSGSTSAGDRSAAIHAARPPIVGRMVVVPAGWRIEQIADLLASNGIVNKREFVSLSRDPAFATRATGFRVPSLEGYLAPGRYGFRRGTATHEVIAAMVGRWRRWLGGHARARARRAGLTVPQVVTLASIVQREVGFSSDMPATAGVLRNRLEHGMRLQSDATVIYALDSARGVGGDPTLYWQRPLSPKRRHARALRFRSPYNTYLHRGLPPAPISSPDITALRSVLHPARVGWVYFLAKPNGANAYATTLAEHKHNIGRYGRGHRHRRSWERQRILQGLVERLAESLDGHLGIVVKNLRSGESAAVNAEDFFSMGDLSGLFVMQAAFQARAQGRLSFDRDLPISPDQALPIRPSIRPGRTLTVRHALRQVIARDDHAAGAALLERLGRGRVQRELRRDSLASTWLTPARFVTTPRDVARLLERIVARRSVSRRSSTAMLRLLLDQRRHDGLPRYLQGRDLVAHLPADLSNGAHDAGVIYTRNGPLVVVALTEGTIDEAQAKQAAARLGEYVVAYFERYRMAALATRRRTRACPGNPFRPRSRGVLDGKTIVLDPGHGGTDSGAQFRLPDGQLLQEKALNLDIALRLRTLLTNRGATVYMTRCRDVTIALEDRVAQANRWRADLFISMHLNGSPDRHEDGSEVFYLPPFGGTLAKYLIGSFAFPGVWGTLNRRGSLPNLGTARARFTVLAFSRAPAALTESLFMTSASEAVALRHSRGRASRREQIARGHLLGILHYFGVRGVL